MLTEDLENPRWQLLDGEHAPRPRGADDRTTSASWQEQGRGILGGRVGTTIEASGGGICVELDRGRITGCGGKTYPQHLDRLESLVKHRHNQRVSSF
jgi:hypothetical protein